MLVPTSGAVRAGAVTELDLAPVEVLLEFWPFAVGYLLVFFGWALRSSPVQERLIMSHDLVIKDSNVAAGGLETEVSEQRRTDMNRPAAVDQFGDEKPAEIVRREDQS